MFAFTRDVSPSPPLLPHDAWLIGCCCSISLHLEVPHDSFFILHHLSRKLLVLNLWGLGVDLRSHDWYPCVFSKSACRVGRLLFHVSASCSSSSSSSSGPCCLKDSFSRISSATQHTTPSQNPFPTSLLVAPKRLAFTSVKLTQFYLAVHLLTRMLCVTTAWNTMLRKN